MPDGDGFPTNEETKAIYDLVNSNTAFKNPVTDSITLLKNNIVSQITSLGVLSSIVDPNGITNWLQQDFIDIIAALDVVATSLDAFEIHTDRVSGKSFPSSPVDEEPNFLTLISASQNLAVVENEIGDVITDTLSQFFGSLTEFPSIIMGWNDILEDLDLKIQMLPPYIPPQYPIQPLPAQTISDISSWAVQMDDKIAQDSINYKNAINTLSRWSSSLSLISPDVVWRDFVYDNIATPELQLLLPEVV